MNLPQILQQLKLPSSKAGYIKLIGGIFAGLVLLLFVVSPSTDNREQRVALPAAPQQTVKPTPPAPPNAENSKIILELFNPSDESLNQQRTETTYAQQIEQTMTVTFVLTKCQLISQDDYSTIYQALVTYAQRVGLGADAPAADARVRQIAESSGASYALVYSRIACDDPQLPPLAKDILTWADGIFKQP